MKSRAKVITQKHIKEIPAYGNSKGWYMSDEKQKEQGQLRLHAMLKPNRKLRRSSVKNVQRKVAQLT